MQRRRFLQLGVLFTAGLGAGCTVQYGECNPALPGPDCEHITAEEGLNQYELLQLYFQGNPPSDRVFSFAVYRNGQFIEPTRSEFEIAEAPEGVTAERSFNPAATELFTFQKGDIVVFTELASTT